MNHTSSRFPSRPPENPSETAASAVAASSLERVPELVPDVARAGSCIAPCAAPCCATSGPDASAKAAPPSDTRDEREERDHRIPLGKSGEDTALTWLLARGYHLIERNYRFGRHGELDLIVESPEGDLAFVEVKTGLSDAAGDPLGWVNGRKQHKIQRIAQAWCLERGIIMDRPMRFDAVGVQISASGAAGITHVPNAFLPDGAGYWRGG